METNVQYPSLHPSYNRWINQLDCSWFRYTQFQDMLVHDKGQCIAPLPRPLRMHLRHSEGIEMQVAATPIFTPPPPHFARGKQAERQSSSANKHVYFNKSIPKGMAMEPGPTPVSSTVTFSACILGFFLFYFTFLIEHGKSGREEPHFDQTKCKDRMWSIPNRGKFLEESGGTSGRMTRWKN